MHHHLKQRLWNGRARCVGLKRQRINLHAYQLRTGIAALIAFHYRTGESIEAWFGDGEGASRDVVGFGVVGGVHPRVGPSA